MLLLLRVLLLQVQQFKWAWLPGPLFQTVLKIDEQAVRCFEAENHCTTPRLVYDNAAVRAPLRQPVLRARVTGITRSLRDRLPELLSPHCGSAILLEQTHAPLGQGWKMKLPGAGWKTNLCSPSSPLRCGISMITHQSPSSSTASSL